MSPLSPGLYTCIKSWKQLNKIRLQRHFFLKRATNEWSEKTFLLTSKLYPPGLSAPAPGPYTCKKSWKILHKIRLQRDFFKLATNDRIDKMFLLTYKIRSQGVVRHCPGALYMCKIVKNIVYNQTSKRFFSKLVANGRRDKRFLLTDIKILSPGFDFAPDLWLYTFIKSWKMCIKSEIEEILLATNDIKILALMGCLALPRGYV